MDSAHDVHIHHQLEVVQRHLGKALVAQDAGVVDQNVHAAPGVHGLLNHFLYRLEVGHRSAVGDGLATCGAYFIHHLLCRRGRPPHAMHITAQVVDHDLGAARCQQQSMLLAQTAASAGDDGHSAFEIDTHVHSLMQNRMPLHALVE